MQLDCGLMESKNEIFLCAEILEAFSEKWIFAKKCAQVLKTLCDNILEVSLTTEGTEVSEMSNLLSEILGITSAYYEILDENCIQMSFTSIFGN
ncbi:unnamed protein product [Penicillium nalgiovense]|nr:unnamed protein product [Penicillium nalgiovense]